MTAGLIILPAGFAGAIFALLGGRILDKFGARKPILIGTSLCLNCAYCFYNLWAAFNEYIYCACLYIFYMGGMGMCMGCVMTKCTNRYW